MEDDRHPFHAGKSRLYMDLVLDVRHDDVKDNIYTRVVLQIFEPFSATLSSSKGFLQGFSARKGNGPTAGASCGHIFSILRLGKGMNPQWRHTGNHILYEDNTWLGRHLSWSMSCILSLRSCFDSSKALDENPVSRLSENIELFARLP